MGIAIIVKGANFAAQSVGNAFFPYYADLVGARFYGDSIPNLTNYKKAKTIGAVTQGGATVATDAYSAAVAAAQQFNTGLLVPSTHTVVNVLQVNNPSTNVAQKFAGTMPTLNSGPGAGQFSKFVSARDTIVQTQLGVGAYTAYAPITVPSATAFPLISISTVDSVGLVATDSNMAHGAINTKSVAVPSAMTNNLPLFLEWNNVGMTGTIQHRAVAVFARVLTPSEQLDVFNFLSLFYASRAIAV